MKQELKYFEELTFKKLNPKGYVLININDKWVLEHRLIMEEYLGRQLKPEEKVHHDDFNKQNNKIDNLTLFPTGSSHNHFHRQLLQFGNTQPRRTELLRLKELMLIEHRNKQ